MKYFIIEGTIKTLDSIHENTMKEHIDYSQKAMDEGLILMSGLKEDMSGGIFVMKAETTEKVERYLSNEPFKLLGIQEYSVIEFSPHYFNFQE